MTFNKITTFISTMVAGLFSFFGLLAIPLLLLVPCMITDWFTGIAASKAQGVKIEAGRSTLGIVKKVSMLILIGVGWALDMLIAYAITTMQLQLVLPNIIACLVAVWLVLNELISITENIEILGVSVPFLSPIMQLIKVKVEETAKVEEK